MIIVFLLIPLSVVVASGFLAAFIWAVRSGQFEDTCTPSMRLLTEDANEKRVGVKSTAAESDNLRSDSGNARVVANCEDDNLIRSED